MMKYFPLNLSGKQAYEEINNCFLSSAFDGDDVHTSDISSSWLQTGKFELEQPLPSYLTASYTLYQPWGDLTYL